MTDDRFHSGPDAVITLSLETWNDLVERQFARPPDRMVQHLRHSDRIGRLLVVNPWRGVAGYAQRRFGGRPDARFPRTGDQHLLRPYRLRRAEPVDVHSLERSYGIYGRAVQAAAAARGFKSPVLVTFNPLFAAFGRHDGFRSVTYVGRDDWASYHRHRHLWPTYEIAYERIRQRRLRVSAVSEVLMQRLAPTAAHRVVPNGVDSETWTDPGPPPSSIRDLPRPLAVYTGTVDERLSVEAFAQIAQAIPGGRVVLVGPARADVAARLRAAGENIVLLPSVGQSELAAIVAAADVCVIPHVRNTLTEAMSPLKLYEYLAAGRRVVATDLLPMHGIHESVSLVPASRSFGAGVLAALAAAPMTEADRRQFIAANSWQSRCESILDLALQEP